MKLPRWLVVSLLSASVLAALGSTAWWWVTWPTRTAHGFTNAIRNGLLAEAGTYVESVPGDDWDRLVPNLQADHQLDQLNPPTFRDVLYSRRTFRISGLPHPYIFTAERGTISVALVMDNLDDRVLVELYLRSMLPERGN